MYFICKTDYVRIRYFIVTLVIFFFMSFIAAANPDDSRKVLNWQPIQKFRITDEQVIYQLYFDGAIYTARSPGIPLYSERFPIRITNAKISAQLINKQFEEINDPNLTKIAGLSFIKDRIMVDASVVFERKVPFAVVSFIPIRKNPSTGKYEKLVSFEIKMEVNEDLSARKYTLRPFKQNSVLATGNWYKIAVNKTGIHKLSYNDLANMGMPVASIDPRNISVYGNGGGMLPEKISSFRYDDLMENAIEVVGEDDGSFDPDDYVLFYAESPHIWNYNPVNDEFNHIINIYSDYTYYFITADQGQGKRIMNQASVGTTPTHYVDRFTDHSYYELDKVNIVSTGRTWFDYPPFDITTSYNYSFTFPNIDLSIPVFIKSSVAARSFTTSNFKYYYNNGLIMTIIVDKISNSAFSAYAKSKTGKTTFYATGTAINLRVDYNKTSTGAIGWMDYIELNAVRFLKYTGSQMSFRNTESVGIGNVAEFIVQNATSLVRIWNVTDPLNITRVNATLNGTNLSFRLHTDSLQEFIAFNGTAYYTSFFIKKVENQNLHGISGNDMIIVSYPSFLSEVYRLAGHHQEMDGLSVFVVEPEKLYNEFSSGAQDITAIRDFMRMLYDKATPGKEPRYLLLFGDASFDYKNRIENNTNFVPTWEDTRSLAISSSIATDDYYGFLDDNEGTSVNETLDLGIGRMPVQSVEQARNAVNKSIHYAGNQPEVMGSWRNVICFVADDEDGNMHINHAEQMAKKIDTTYKNYNIDKIYVDAYPQVSTPGGQRSPEVNAAIKRKIEKGTLIMNYTGHGGEVGWGHERILNISDINAWSNFDKLSVFITATCEFSRYDDPERTSAGELVFLNPVGGAVSMFTTARATYGSSNFHLNSAIYDYAFEKINGEYPRFGDLIMMAKNQSGYVTENDKKFILFGDPAIHLAYPQFNVVTNTINGTIVNIIPDTLKALKKITVTGEIQDDNSNKINGFNGIIYPIVFDKPSKIKTLASDPSSYPYIFEIRNSILYKGMASITNGEFSFTFIVPKDIAYQFGYGKISYYANNPSDDASGYYENVIIGGYGSGVVVDDTGPEIEIYMNDDSFVFGGITDENPVLVAFMIDSSGINTVGNGIGHDIVTVLDKNTEKSINLNDYYEADMDSYKSGSIRYPFSELEDGSHTLSLKVWDVYNNSSSAYTEFVVAESAELAIEHILNYPNPFTTHTEFYFEHNQPNSTLEVLLQVFTISGKLVYSYNDIIITNGFRSGPIPPYGWDGMDDFGDCLGRGVYLYKFRVRTMDGSYADKLEKLVILR